MEVEQLIVGWFCGRKRGKHVERSEVSVHSPLENVKKSGEYSNY